MILWVVFSLYIFCLVAVALFSRRQNNAVVGSVSHAEQFLFGGYNLNPLLGFLTFSATLFSTFTILGMPNYFRTQGIGAWLFLGVTDVILALVAFWFGYLLRRRLAGQRFAGIAAIIGKTYGGRVASSIYILAVFLFLLPYVAIQIKGCAFFMDDVTGSELTSFGWAVGILTVMILYSRVGGFRAVVYSDALQGVLLLLVLWYIAWISVKSLGGIDGMFRAVAAVNSDLLSLPGPNGRFSMQFLLMSLVSIILMPLTQPQLTHRLAVVSGSRRSAPGSIAYELNGLKQMCFAVGIFAILTILPTIAIGMYGAVHYPDASASSFLASALVADWHPLVGALACVGLLAAAMSTTDSQLMAVSTEVLGRDSRREGIRVNAVKLLIVCFAVLALFMAFMSTQEIVDLARRSFIGTAMVAPMVLFAVMGERKLKMDIPLACLGALIAFIGTLAGIVPQTIGGIETGLVLMVVAMAYGAVSYSLQRTAGPSREEASSASV